MAVINIGNAKRSFFLFSSCFTGIFLNPNADRNIIHMKNAAAKFLRCRIRIRVCLQWRKCVLIGIWLSGRPCQKAERI